MLPIPLLFPPSFRTIYHPWMSALIRRAMCVRKEDYKSEIEMRQENRVRGSAGGK